jgi:hypothetical protein
LHETPTARSTHRFHPIPKPHPPTAHPPAAARIFESTISTNSTALNATRDGPSIFEFLPYFGLSSDPTKVNVSDIKAVFK